MKAAKEQIEFRPWLVQRVKRPCPYLVKDTDNKYLPDQPCTLVDFYLNREHIKEKGQQSDYKSGIDAINCSLSCDYMGAAEYEWGAVGECLQQIVAHRKDLIPFKHVLYGHPAPPSWPWDPKKEKAPTSMAKQVVLTGWCKNEHKNALSLFLEKQLQGEFPRHSLKEPTMLRASCFGQMRIKPVETVQNDITGWLDLHNLWFVGRDPQQVKDVAYLLGVKL
jgi:hypothetical protein